MQGVQEQHLDFHNRSNLAEVTKAYKWYSPKRLSQIFDSAADIVNSFHDSNIGTCEFFPDDYACT
jgi:hypothetical protein